MNMKMVAAAVLAGAVVAGCGEQEETAEQKEDVLAISVNGEKLMQSAVDEDVERVIAAQGANIPAEQLEMARQQIASQLVQSFLFEKVLVAKAKSLGFEVTDADRKAREAEFLKAMSNSKDPNAPKSVDELLKKHPLGLERARAEMENGILIDKLIKAEQAKAPKADKTAEAKKVVDNIVSNNAVAAASVTNSLIKIKALKAQLDKVPPAQLAAKFAELAKANSDCPSKANGGDLGEFGHGQMVKEFDEAAFKMPLNKVSDPIKTQFGYHLLMVTKKIPAVAAQGDKPATGEKVQASHILLKISEPSPVPKVEDVAKRMNQMDERTFVQNFVKKQLAEAQIEASEQYKRFLPEKERPVCSDAACGCEEKTPVEKPAGK